MYKSIISPRFKFNKMISNIIKPSPNYVFDYNTKEKVNIVSDDYYKKLKIMKENPNKLILVSDFDYTLTKKHHKDTHLYSSYCVLEYSNFISEEYRKANSELFEKYYRYEIDTLLDFDERDKMVKIWFKENLDLIVGENLTKDNFRSMVQQAEKRLFFRDGIIELFEIVRKHSIPFFIISGGLRDVIEEAMIATIPFYAELKERKLIHVISNGFLFDQDTGKITGFTEPFVYTFNKGQILSQIYHEYHTGDRNIILMGDHLNDTDCIKQIDYNEEIKIGFINYFEDSLDEQKIKLIEEYHLKYDVSIINDGNLTFVNSLIKSIVDEKKEE